MQDFFDQVEATHHEMQRVISFKRSMTDAEFQAKLADAQLAFRESETNLLSANRRLDIIDRTLSSDKQPIVNNTAGVKRGLDDSDVQPPSPKR